MLIVRPRIKKLNRVDLHKNMFLIELQARAFARILLLMFILLNRLESKLKHIHSDTLRSHKKKCRSQSSQSAIVSRLLVNQTSENSVSSSQAAHAFLEESVKKLRFIASDVRESVQASRHAVVTESVDRPKLASFLSIMARVAATWTYPGAPEPRILVVTNR